MLASAAEPIWSLDREIVLSRVFDAPRELVFRMWTEREHITRWFGPRGFTCTTHEMEARVGGRWRFEMVSPDGKVFTNRIEYLEITPPERLVFDHGSDQDDDPNRFRVTITFDEQADKKTVVTMRQLHPSKARRDAGIGFGAVELGYQTLDKLAAHLRTVS
jgi:uncharacterized protein YndB with AHSA1/START domain